MIATRPISQASVDANAASSPSVFSLTDNAYYLWDGPNLLEERDGSGNLQARHTHGYTKIPGIGSVMETQRIADGATYFMYGCMDHRGTAYAVTDAAQNIQLGYTQDAFGIQLAPVGGANPAVPNDLIYQTNWLTLNIGGKNYVISPARLTIDGSVFLQRDALPSLNKYVVVSNNPVGRVDPTGLADGCQDRRVTWRKRTRPVKPASNNCTVKQPSTSIGIPLPKEFK